MFYICVPWFSLIVSETWKQQRPEVKTYHHAITKLQKFIKKSQTRTSKTTEREQQEEEFPASNEAKKALVLGEDHPGPSGSGTKRTEASGKSQSYTLGVHLKRQSSLRRVYVESTSSLRV